MTRLISDRGTRVFLLVWFGRLVSLLGSGLTNFAVCIWVYQQTGSVTQYSMTLLSIVLPSILITPLAGALVDRWDRRWTMILSNIGGAFSTLAIALLIFTGRLELWHVRLALAISAIFNDVLHRLAFAASVTSLVPQKHLGRASGMMTGLAAVDIISPMFAAMLLGAVQIQGVILADISTFLFAAVTLLLVRIPQPEPNPKGELAMSSLLEEAAYGWSYISERPGLIRLLLFFAFINFILEFSTALFMPLLLSFASVKVAGTIATIIGSGILLGTIVMSAWGGPKRRMYGILGFGIVFGLSLTLGMVHPSAPLIAVAGFIAVFCVPNINGCNQAIWLSKTPPDVQGRVFAVGAMIRSSLAPLAFLIAGPLADKVFEPLLVVGGPLAGSVGQLIGVGPGRGIALLYSAMGIITMLVITSSYISSRLRLVEDELPDVIVKEASAKAQAERRDSTSQRTVKERILS